MNIKKLIKITDQQASDLATSISITNSQRLALIDKKIVQKLTSDTKYTEITYDDAITALTPTGVNYAQNLVTRLINGEIIYYPSGEIKLSTTNKCDRCKGGYLGTGITSIDDKKSILCPSCGRNETAEQIFDIINS